MIEPYVSPVCTVCKSAAGSFGGKCGTCIAADGKEAVDFMPGLKIKQLTRKREMETGVFPQEMIDLGKLEAMQYVEQKPDVGEKLTKKPQEGEDGTT